MIHPQRLLNGWRRAHFAAAAGLAATHAVPAADDVAVNAVPPIVAAALCIKPRGMLTQAQAAKVVRLNSPRCVSWRCASAACSRAAMLRRLRIG